MDKRIRVYVAWRGRDFDLRDTSRQLAAFIAALRGLHKRLEGFKFIEKPSGKEVILSDLEACQRALEAHRVDWATGPVKRVASQPRLFLERSSSPPVEAQLTCGITKLNLGPIYTPNRLDLRLRRDAGEDLVNPSVVEGLLRAAVEAFKPDWGFAGVEGYPEPPLPIFSDGAPAVSWMTFLSQLYPPIPTVLPKPAVAHVLGRLGTLIVAHPELWNEIDPAHVQAVEKVRETLEKAGVLVP